MRNPENRLDAAEARRLGEHAARLLADDARVSLVYLFGSAMPAGPPTVGDVDLAVLTDPPVAFDELMKRRADIVLATGAPIDLVSLGDASIALAYEVVESGLCLYARSQEIETDFVTRTRSRYWDFKPYRDEQWRLAGERLAERRRGS